MIDGEEYSPWLSLRDGSGFDPAYAPLDLPLGIDHSSPSARLTLFAVGGDRVNAAPQTAMINTVLLREHNRLAGLIESANPTWADGRVFETARNAVIVMFIKIVIEDYINHINSTQFKLRANPEVAYRAKWNRPNWITAEFALLYRWHSLVPQTMTWGGTPYDGMLTLLDNSVLLQRGLVGAFVDMSANRATQLGLGNSATFLLRAEAKAVEQARLTRLASFASYCQAMGKTVPESFDDLVGTNLDVENRLRRSDLAKQLQALYGTVDNVEFYVGLFAEPTGTNGPLPDLVNSMVAMDAFSQALTNPLLSEHIWGDKVNRKETFSPEGLSAIEATSTLRDLVARNSTGLGEQFVGMTRNGWSRRKR